MRGYIFKLGYELSYSRWNCLKSVLLRWGLRDFGRFAFEIKQYGNNNLS